MAIPNLRPPIPQEAAAGDGRPLLRRRQPQIRLPRFSILRRSGQIQKRAKIPKPPRASIELALAFNPNSDTRSFKIVSFPLPGDDPVRRWGSDEVGVFSSDTGSWSTVGGIAGLSEIMAVLYKFHHGRCSLCNKFSAPGSSWAHCATKVISGL
ncbi:uncharacterized protein LOC109836374 [Asparagus officinalis]|uniref:uncharacterized protein LOC109836374 n=1 Tax=Asparagus officinalis TaxID=4686 RepID=UPI00098E775A|nr:uncharacterized protein LOC109836374 [Asparagus officinalis]